LQQHKCRATGEQQLINGEQHKVHVCSTQHASTVDHTISFKLHPPGFFDRAAPRLFTSCSRARRSRHPS
jgi:hypothetical protein